MYWLTITGKSDLNPGMEKPLYELQELRGRSVSRRYGSQVVIRQLHSLVSASSEIRSGEGPWNVPWNVPEMKCLPSAVIPLGRTEHYTQTKTPNWICLNSEWIFQASTTSVIVSIQVQANQYWRQCENSGRRSKPWTTITEHTLHLHTRRFT